MKCFFLRLIEALSTYFSMNEDGPGPHASFPDFRLWDPKAEFQVFTVVLGKTTASILLQSLELIHMTKTLVEV
jgi:hypothetical protein